MKKKSLLLLICTMIAMFSIGCGNSYKSDDFIGRTSADIINEFGPFDCVTMSADTDGLYKNCSCGYTIKEARKGFPGTSAEVLFFVVFDENGMAVECEEGYRPGG